MDLFLLFLYRGLYLCGICHWLAFGMSRGRGDLAAELFRCCSFYDWQALQECELLYLEPELFMNCPFKTGDTSFQRENSLHHERNGIDIYVREYGLGRWRLCGWEVSGPKENNTDSEFSPLKKSSQNLS